MGSKVLLLLTSAVAAAIAMYALQSEHEPTALISAANAMSSVITGPSSTRNSVNDASQKTDKLEQKRTEQLTTGSDSTNNTNNDSLCLQNDKIDESRCTLRHDIDLSNAFAYSPTQLDGKKVTLALVSTNFEQLHQLLEKANTSQEASLRQADFQAAFNEFYKYSPGLLDNIVSCSDEICAASFTVADTYSAQQISKAMERFTQQINAHSFSTQGRDNADNLQVKLIFSNSAAFKTVVH